MITVIFAVILIFFALLGIAAVVDGVVSWLSRAGSLAGSTLTIALKLTDDEETAEATLLHGAHLAETHGMALRVVCDGDCPAWEIAKRFCIDRGLSVSTGDSDTAK